VIYTIAPYLLPQLVPKLIEQVPQMPLVLQENFTVRLLELLRSGELDAAVMALPFNDQGLMVQALYDEPFMVAVPRNHHWCDRASVSAEELKNETMLLLGAGHCFRDQVLEVCPEMARYSTSGGGIARTFEGSSLETIRHMVASGIGITVLPKASVPASAGAKDMLRYLPFDNPPPSRRVVIAWRKSFTRQGAIDAIRKIVLSCTLNGVTMLPDARQAEH
jgi:LysR family hydrogen peroxide-inducible transcriptional activator